jgi:hypothetical protein
MVRLRLFFNEVAVVRGRARSIRQAGKLLLLVGRGVAGVRRSKVLQHVSGLDVDTAWMSDEPRRSRPRAS